MPLLLTDGNGNPTSTDLNGAFAAGTVGQPVDYLVRELRNTGGGSLTAGRLYVTPDAAGGGFAVAVLDGTARDLSYAYVPTPSSGSYSTPTDAATGLVLPDLAAGKKCLIACRRDLTTASVPPGGVEVNTVRAAYTAPITYA